MTDTRTSGRDATRPPRPVVTVAGYREDRLFPRIERAVAAILRRGKVVAPVDVLVEMDLLVPEHLDDWRRGKVPYLERVIRCNLQKLSRLLRILRFHAHDLDLVPSVTACMRWGKGPKQRLRFTKTGDSKLEEAYARHFVWLGKSPSGSARNLTLTDPTAKAIQIQGCTAQELIAAAWSFIELPRS